MPDLTFEAIDLTCDATDKSFFVPHITFTTRSTTKIATVLGFPEYIPSVPPKRYMVLSWNGTSEQISRPLNGGNVSSDSKYEYSGSSAIDVNGNLISTHSKNLLTPCPESDYTPTVNSALNFGVNKLLGYCWTPDPNSCPACNPIPQFKADVGSPHIFDEPFGTLGVGPGFTVYTATSATNNTTNTAAIALTFGPNGGVTNFPLAESGGVFGPWILVSTIHNYFSTLSQEYTDAQALAQATVIVSNGATAENQPRTIGFTSRFTGVQYTLQLSNLIVGESYLVTVNFRQAPFATPSTQIGLVAKAPTMVITGNVPNPPVGGTMTITGATITFA